MKTHFLFIIGTLSFVGSVFLFSARAQTDSPTIVITEIGAYESSGHEWVEIHNVGSDAVDMTTWKFVEDGTNHGLTTSTDTSVLAPGSYGIIAQDGATFLADYSHVSVPVFDSSWGTLNESGETIGLRNSEGAMVEEFTYIAAPDFSLERIDPSVQDYTSANWIEHPDSNTAGAENYWHVGSGHEPPSEDTEPPVVMFSISSSSAPIGTEIIFDASASTDDSGIATFDWDFGDDTSATGESTSHEYSTEGTYTVLLTITDTVGNTGSSTADITITPASEDPTDDPPEEEPPTQSASLSINEFLPEPNTGESEWIELYNASTTTINLTDWTLHDGAGQIWTTTSTIDAESFFIIELSASKLNNPGDMLVLKNPAGEEIDTIAYGNWDGATVGAPKKGNTLARKANGTFTETTSPTKGAENIITAPITDTPSSGGGSGSTTPPPVTKTSYAEGIIVINELVSDPTDGEDEFVELYNTGESLDLAGWWIEDGSETKTTLTGTIASKGFFVIPKPKGNLNNAGDIIFLLDPTGKEIDRVSYGTWDDGNLSDNAPAPSDPLSLARRVDGLDADNDFYDFVLTDTITKGKKNIISLTTEDEQGKVLGANIYTTDIKITELYPNPPGSDNDDEFIELQNTSAETVDITGWKLGDSSTKRYTIKEGSTKPGAFMVFKRSMTGIALNNTGGDEVGLYDPSDAIIERAQYKGSSPEGQSWARKEDGSWAWTTEVTPSETNKISGKSAAPLITIDVDTQVVMGERVTFDASDTTDPDAESMIFVWTFGDNGTGEGSVVDHTFSQEGTYTVTLLVTDASGNSSTKDVVIIVKNRLSFAGGFDATTPIEKIEISEILPNPEGSDTTEFVELHNPTDEIIDLSDMKLDDEEGGSRAYTIPSGTTIAPGAYLVFGRQDTKLAFNNTSDSARILFPDGTVLRDIRYDDVLEGHSYVRDENDEWVWTSSLTPGTATILSPPDEGKKSKTTTAKSKMVKPIIATTLTHIRSEDIGDMITVTGTVAVLPNVLGTQYFYIVGSPGVQVYMYKKDFPKLAVGDVVKITGELSEVSGETRLKVSEKENIEFVQHTALPASHPIEIASVGEEYEGWLIEVHGEVTEAKSSYMYVDDGTDEVQVYYKSGAGINAKTYQPGDLVKVTGILSQTKTGYRLLPRAQSDIVKTGVVDDVIVRQEAIKEESSKEVAEKYLTATAGGLTALLVGLLAKTRADTLRTIFTSIQNGLRKLFRKKK